MHLVDSELFIILQTTVRGISYDTQYTKVFQVSRFEVRSFTFQQKLKSFRARFTSDIMSQRCHVKTQLIPSSRVKRQFHSNTGVVAWTAKTTLYEVSASAHYCSLAWQHLNVWMRRSISQCSLWCNWRFLMSSTKNRFWDGTVKCFEDIYLLWLVD